MAFDILIIDDENDIRELVAGILQDEGYNTRTAGNTDSALQAIAERRPTLIFLDIWLQGSQLDGLELLAIIKEQHAELPVVMISGHGNIETAVSAIKAGAYDFIEKPFEADRLILIAERALESFKLKREVKELRERSSDTDELIGSSSIINQVRHLIERIAPTNSRVMIMGPSGSGKELIARNIHEYSKRSNGPFVVLNAATIQPDTMEIELFGIEANRGRVRKIGALEEAHGGTLYLDEVADMPKETQNKILRVLVDQKFQRIDGATRIHVDVRILSSTARDLEALIQTGEFREDLFHRLCVVPLAMPALSERREDIPELIHHFMHKISHATGLPTRIIADDAMAVLQAHDWPGNIRQLHNNIERLMILARGDDNEEITADLLPEEVSAMLPKAPGGEGSENLMALPLREAREIFEHGYLTAQINRFGGNISRTAEFVGMERSALHRKLKSLGIH